MGDEFDTGIITERLNIIPSIVWNMGDAIRNIGKKRTYTAWIYEIKPENTLDINTQLIKIEQLFADKADILCDLKKQYELDFSIDLVIIIENKEVPAIYFHDPIIQFAAKINARIDVDTYVN